MLNTTQFPAAAQASVKPAMAFQGKAAFATPQVQFDGFFGNRSARLAKYIDSTLLMYPEGSTPFEAIRKLCREARENNFCAVCVRPDKVRTAKDLLGDSGVKVATVVGFPEKKSKLYDEMALQDIGDVKPFWKIVETSQAIKDGADEIDLVMNVHQFLAESDKPTQLQTLREFQLIRELSKGKTLKIIIETDLLTQDQIKKATILCAKAGADFVKTSTGMIEGGKGATVENVRLIHDTLAMVGALDHVGIKASGGVKTTEDARSLIKAGATRLGTSSGFAIVHPEESSKQESGKAGGY